MAKSSSVQAEVPEVKDWARVVERTITIKYHAPVDQDSDVNVTDPTLVLFEFTELTPYSKMGDFFSVSNRELTKEEAVPLFDELAARFIVAALTNPL
jgi:hypothetical protein